MAVAVMVEVPGLTAAQYDAILPLVWPGGQMPKGGLFHVAGEDNGVWRVVDVWDTAESFQAFAQSTLANAMQQVGVTGAPKITIWPVHKTAHTH